MSRTFTRDEVEQVVTSMVGHPDCRTNGAAYDVGWDRCAREVLRRLDALPDATDTAPVNLATRRTPPEERAEGGLLVNLDGLPTTCSNPGCRESGHGFEQGQLCGRLLARPEKWSGTYRTANLPGLQRIAEGLGYTWATERSPDPAWTYASLVRVEVPRLAVVPASPPDAPESARPAVGVVEYGVMLARHQRNIEQMVQRPRAATPTPEVPALKAEPHYRCADPDCEAPERPEPTAPHVVWEGEGVRVLADGTWWFFGQNLREWLPASDGNEPQTDALARALAEAKRQTAELGQEVALKQAALDGHARDFRDARKAAESMRERAMALIMVEQARQEDGPLSDDNGHAFNLLLRLADAVGALPLEES